jgi:hypothetical protein
MLQALAAGALALHGVIHLIGFVVPWRLAQVEGFPYRASALNGAVQLGDAGARLVGVAWLGLAVGFLVAGFATWRGAPWAGAVTGGLAIASIAVCALGLPEATTGIVVNVTILGVLALAARLATTGTDRLRSAR